MDYSLINLKASQAVHYFYLTDDLVINLNSSFGEFLKANPATTVEVALLSGSAVVTTYEAQTDLANGSDFANGIINVVLDNTVLDAQARGLYRLVVRLTTDGLQRTFITFATINLLNI